MLQCYYVIVTKLLQLTSIFSKSNPKTCQVFYLDNIVNWHIASVKHFTLHHKHIIILYYYSIFLVQKGGIVYIFRTFIRHVNRHICSIHKLLVKSAFPRHFTQTITSVPTSTKPTKIKHFTTSQYTKNHYYPPRNPLKPL